MVAQWQKAGTCHAGGPGLDTQCRGRRERRDGGRVKRRGKPQVNLALNKENGNTHRQGRLSVTNSKQEPSYFSNQCDKEDQHLDLFSNLHVFSIYVSVSIYLCTVTPNYILGKLPPCGADFFLKLRHLHAVHQPTIQAFFSTSPESMPCQLLPRQEDRPKQIGICLWTCNIPTSLQPLQLYSVQQPRRRCNGRCGSFRELPFTGLHFILNQGLHQKNKQLMKKHKSIATNGNEWQNVLAQVQCPAVLVCLAKATRPQ